MQFYGYHGLIPEENTLGQRFEVDLEIFSDFRGYSRSCPEDALKYPDAYDIVERVVTKEVFGLVEELADAIAEALQIEMGISQLVVRVRKPHAPVAKAFGGIEVEVRRGG
jgi:dihydroneopterin aldolase